LVGLVGLAYDIYHANDDFVAVIDLATNTVESTIPVSEGPEHIESIDGKLYVSHKGGYGYGTTISVIDAANTVASTITVGDVYRFFPSTALAK